jgi:hypothetical protein
MADAVTTTTIQDGDRIAVIQLTNTSDGTGESAVTKIDVSGLAANSSNKQACTGVKLGRIVYSTFGMSVKLLWDATTKTLFVGTLMQTIQQMKILQSLVVYKILLEVVKQVI